MTSSLGAEHLMKMGEGQVKSPTRDLVMRSIRGHFSPDFVNRIDCTVIFVSTSIFNEL